MFVMLNPSTADAEVLDPTVRRCVGFAVSWGFGSIDVANLFAYRSTNPAQLRRVVDPVGPENDFHIRELASSADLVVAAWGNHGGLQERGRTVLNTLSLVRTVSTLGLTKLGHPSHPLYLPATTRPRPVLRAH